nr:MAG TPA: virion morphogenesis protein [Caudoviricetes sp.]
MIPKEKLQDLHIDMEALANLVAMTGTSYFRGTFRSKSFDGVPWAPAKIDLTGKRRRGSLMVDSAALMNSVRAAEVTPQRIVWSAGNDKVPYAEVHNTGGRAGRGRGFTMPKRQFIGDSAELQAKIEQRINTYLRTVLK